MRPAILITLFALTGSALAEPGKRIVKLPPDTMITLRYDDQVVIPMPRGMPHVQLVPLVPAFGDARAFPLGMVLVLPPAPRRVIAVFREVPPDDDTGGNPLVDLGLGLGAGAIVLAGWLATRRREAMHPVGML